MAFEAPFDSVAEARDTYYGSGDGGSEWGNVETIDELAGGWELMEQTRTDGSQRRYFVSNGAKVINSSGESVSFSPEQDLDTVPNHATEQDARDAHARWLENNSGEDEEEEDGGDGGQTPPWEEAVEVPPWFVYARQIDPETAEYCIAGVVDGANVYLAPNAKVRQKIHVYSSIEAVDRALNAYFEAVDNGDIPEEDQPTGQRPDPPSRKGGGSTGLGGIMATLRQNPAVAVGAVAVGAFALTRNGGSP